MVSAPSKNELVNAAAITLGNSGIRVKLKPWAGLISLYREVGFEYLSLNPSRLKQIRISFNRVVQEIGQNGSGFLLKMWKTYELKLDNFSALHFVSEVSVNSKTWVSRRGVIQGFKPYALRHNIEYDFSRSFYDFKFLIWGIDNGLNTSQSILESISNKVLVEVEFRSVENTPELFFLEHQDAQIHHGDLVAVGPLRHPIDSWNLFDGSIPMADLARIGDHFFAISADSISNELISKAICFGSSTNWYHFIVEVFPRYLLFGVSNLVNSTIVIPEGAPRQVQEVLSYISENPLYLAKPRESLSCQKVISCVDTRIQDGLNVQSRKKDLEAVRNFFDETGFLTTRKPFRKVLIRRAGSLFRSIQNFNELEVLLLEQGFEVVDPAAISVKEQAMLFSEARVVIGQAGAAFTNFIFVSPASHIIEFSDTGMEDTFWKEFALCFAATHEKFVLKRKGMGTLRRFAPSFAIDLKEFKAYCRARNYWD